MAVFLEFKYLENSHCPGFLHHFLAFFSPFLVPCTVGNNPFSSSSKEGGKKRVRDLEVDVDRGGRGCALLSGGEGVMNKREGPKDTAVL